MRVSAGHKLQSQGHPPPELQATTVDAPVFPWLYMLKLHHGMRQLLSIHAKGNPRSARGTGGSLSLFVPLKAGGDTQRNTQKSCRLHCIQWKNELWCYGNMKQQLLPHRDGCQLTWYSRKTTGVKNQSLSNNLSNKNLWTRMVLVVVFLFTG